MNRRDFVKLSGLGALTLGAAPVLRQQETVKADITLRIAPVTVELAPDRIISTVGYNDTSPGPVLKMREGVPTSVDVINDTDVPEQVHWHGLLIPAEVDGADEEGTPPVPPHGRRRYQFTPKPAGTRWYHTHTMAMSDLHRGSYTGQFGFLVVEGSNPGAYDQEVFLALRDWEPFFTSMLVDTDEQNQKWPQPERPAVLDTRPNGLEVGATIHSINDKALGAGEPIRVQSGQRVMMHVLNASAIENRGIALPGHRFRVIALDGNPVPTPAFVDQLFLGPGERVDALVEMNQPGVWIMGAPEDDIRNGGLGVVIEYANQRRQPQWIAPGKPSWDYTVFGKPGTQPSAADPSIQTIDMAFEKVPRGLGRFNSFTVNGKAYPHEQEFVLKQGTRYRIIFRNRTDDAHPLHIHRHVFELTEIYGKPTAGIMKDTVVVPFYGRATVEMDANQPGLTFFHCHIQHHMDFGFKALFRYA
ncbi:MAG TPA: multicopper oxidase domain-containing protein [Vicinamibacterales bacterium]|nr:multicopper oxidase domain-containing protein [Vicinamibacterales bacterium]